MKSTATIVAIVGMPGSGKSEVAQFFKDKHIPVLRFGDVTDEGLNEKGMSLTEENEREFREGIRKELGMAAMAIKLAPKITSLLTTSPLIVLDGLYSWEEYVYLKKEHPLLRLLHVYASPKVRYARLQTRTVRPLHEELARERDYAEIENLNKGGPIAMADRVIINESSKESLNLALEQYFETL